jgi:3-oxoacyl-[acyl-carrier-protein] synthase-3
MSNQITAAITAVAGFVPDYVLTNEELEKMVDTNDRNGFKPEQV